ncbi:ATP-binding cassette subfamily B protein [Lachnotalea glycerini]|uniref:ATP-binding cassette subfamily B protein n=1 Tax=Lachnotalea glycerini TaxID=1763509 RepID=A0A318ET91_9FIRM|nr:ABC transporter ATP-binding protein [Lachnotalea glycerini]PXV95730.1 ATP-binding cassette subfamily B protein [Lachnotalea glycerini]
MLKQALKYYKPYQALFIIDLLCAVAVAIIELLFPYAISHIVDELLPMGKWIEMIKIGVLLLIAYIFNTFLYMVIDYWGEKLGMYIENDMRNDLFTHLQKMSYRFFDNNKTGQLIARVSNDLHQIGTVAHYAPEQLIVASSMLITTVIIMFSISKLLAGLILLNVGLLLGININFTKKMVNTSRELFGNVGEMAAQLEENFAGIRVVQAYSYEEQQRKSFQDITLEYCSKQQEGFKRVAVCNGITYYVTKLLPVLIILTGGWLTLHQEISEGQFFSFILLTNMVLKPIEMISNFVARYPKGIAGFKNFMEIMQIEPEIADAQDAVEVDKLKGEIEFSNVAFSYDEGKPVFSQLSLEIKEGETIAFVGSSGAGKSTICNLIPRFYEIEKGQIKIQGMDIKKIKLSSLRKQIGVVAQDVFLFSGTIEENIRFGKPEASEEELWEAAKKAMLYDFIQGQPKGMKTVIGERGIKLSGGQKQRLSIARMFLKNPPILILDEATSALDAENEMEIHKALKQLSLGRTTLLIAHRFSTIRDANRIIVVDPGGKIEEGSHDTLMQSNITYKKLYQLQQNGKAS